MEKYFIVFFLFYGSHIAKASPHKFLLQGGATDTIIREQNENFAPQTSHSLEQSEVVNINNFTSRGFKNLFITTTYNSTLPYSSQVNPHAEAFMNDYLRKQGKYLMNMKSWGLPYFNLIDQIFSQYGIPKELKYLAVIESSLQSSSTSSVGAVGPWQFMRETGTTYGLKINNEIDERRDYVKSTHAAAKYLLKLYKDFEDWLLVIAAYNCGEVRVKNVIKKKNTKDFWELQYELPTETRNHVKKFIATHYIMEATDVNKKLINPDNKSNSNDNEGLDEEKNESIIISGKYYSNVLAKYLSMNLSVFNRLNPNFDNEIRLTGTYRLTLPKETMKVFSEKKYTILNECIQIMLQ